MKKRAVGMESTAFSLTYLRKGWQSSYCLAAKHGSWLIGQMKEDEGETLKTVLHMYAFYDNYSFHSIPKQNWVIDEESAPVKMTVMRMAKHVFY